MGLSIEVTDKIARKLHEDMIDNMSSYVIADPNTPALSTRQRQCLNFLLCGLTAKDIANKLQLSVRTVENHIECIKVKFKCSTKSDLINKILSVVINHPE